MVGALLAVGLAVAGCGDKAASSPAPARTPAVTTSGTPSPGATPITPQAVGAGSDGLTVRYTDGDGRLKTLPVEDFPR